MKNALPNNRRPLLHGRTAPIPSPLPTGAWRWQLPVPRDIGLPRPRLQRYPPQPRLERAHAQVCRA